MSTIHMSLVFLYVLGMRRCDGPPQEPHRYDVMCLLPLYHSLQTTVSNISCYQLEKPSHEAIKGVQQDCGRTENRATAEWLALLEQLHHI